MDENSDDFVDKKELVHWTLRALQNMDARELKEDWEVSIGLSAWDCIIIVEECSPSSTPLRTRVQTSGLTREDATPRCLSATLAP